MTGENARRWQAGMVGGGIEIPWRQRGPRSFYARKETKLPVLQVQYFSEKNSKPFLSRQSTPLKVCYSHQKIQSLFLETLSICG